MLVFPATASGECYRALPISFPHPLLHAIGWKLCLCVCALPLAHAAWLQPASAAEAQRPHIVMIVADDQGADDFGFMGNLAIRTPHLDRLATRSARFPGGYVPTSLCRPSLATLLTGLYPHQHGIHFTHPPDETQREQAEYLIRSVQTLPRVLGTAGYRTMQTGKHWEGHYRNAGFTDGMTHPIEGRLGLRKGHGNGDAGLAIGREGLEPIFEFVRSHGDDGPMFIWYAPYLPHTPHNAPQKFAEPYLGDPDIPRHFVRYYANCSWFDDTVGQLVGFFEDRGLARNTLFVFVVDNGWQPNLSGSVDPRSKRSPFDAGLRTPILLRWDGRIEAGSHQGLVSSIDLVPTLLAAAGLQEKMPGLPGENLLPVARKETMLRGKPVYGEIYPGDATRLGHPSGDIAYRWMREGDWKLIVPHQQRGRFYRNYLRQVGLFRLDRDPQEETNLATGKDFQQRLSTMRRDLNDWWIPGNDRNIAEPPSR